MIKPYFCLLVSFLFVSFFVGCDEATDGKEESTSLKVVLIDAPADYQEVNIDIKDVQVKFGEEDSGFVSLENVEAGIYDLLELTAGVEAILADVEIPAGYLNQIRLILGDENSVQVNDEVHDLKIPSGSESGLKLMIHKNLDQGEAYNLVMDFDAARSIHSAGKSGKYMLKPVIKAFVEGADSTQNLGAINGSVEPAVRAWIAAISASKDTTSTYTDDEGDFHIKGLDEGIYTLQIQPTVESGLQSQFIDSVAVVLGEKTKVGTIELTE